MLSNASEHQIYLADIQHELNTADTEHLCTVCNAAPFTSSAAPLHFRWRITVTAECIADETALLRHMKRAHPDVPLYEDTAVAAPLLDSHDAGVAMDDIGTATIVLPSECTPRTTT